MDQDGMGVGGPPSGYARLFRDLPVAVAVFDEHGRVVEANGALCALLGYTHEKITGMDSGDLLDTRDQSESLTAQSESPTTQSESPTTQSESPTAQSESLTAQSENLTSDQRHLIDAAGNSVFCDVFTTPIGGGDGRRRWMSAFVDVGRRRTYTTALHRETTHDELTGLLNRKGTRELLDRLLGQDAADADRRMAVLFCDIDNFKRINDALGHEIGDEVLVTVARRLQEGLPAGCVPARHSGDEFLVICPDLGAVGGLETLSEQVRSLLQTTVAPYGYVIGISVSIGAATVHQTSQTSADLLRYADAAMYRAKDGGPGRVVRADPALLSSIENQVAVESELRQALHTDGLALHYQPIVNRDGRVLAAEALLRWPHPERGNLSPAVILPAARHAGLLSELDQWVLRTATRDAAGWPTPSGCDPVAVTVNLGSQLLHDPALLETITEAITTADLTWQRLILEVTETDIVELTDAIETVMHKLLAQGARFAVDDFGSGHSSLARLKTLPAQLIKLDRQFVSTIEHNPADTAIAEATLTIANAVGSTPIAEGVETPEQLTRLIELGYHAFQGFLFSAAIPNSDLANLITTPLTHR